MGPGGERVDGGGGGIWEVVQLARRCQGGVEKRWWRRRMLGLEVVSKWGWGVEGGGM